MNDIPVGKQYRHVYIERSVPRGDNPRMRRRLSTFFQLLDIENLNIGILLERKLGVRIPRSGMGYYLYEDFFEECNIADFLSAITLISHAIRTNQYAQYKYSKWISEIREIFTEENVAYKLDDSGGVHPLIDEEFEHNKVSTIKELGLPRYKAALKDFEEAYKEFNKIPPNSKAAIRGIFLSVETVFRLLFPGVKNLNGSDVKSLLPTLTKSIFNKENSHHLISMSKMCESFADWVDSVHFYRHGQAEETPTQPPISLAVLLISQGSSYLRWLVEIDALNIANSTSPNLSANPQNTEVIS